MTAFTRTVPIRFSHCDPAGIVFFPQFFALVNEMVEDWFAGPLDCPFNQLHIGARMGVPTVHLEADFLAPARLGDQVRQTLFVEGVGASSCTLSHDAWLGDTKLARFRQTLVHVALDTMKAAPWPVSLRARMQLYGGKTT